MVDLRKISRRAYVGACIALLTAAILYLLKVFAPETFDSPEMGEAKRIVRQKMAEGKTEIPVSEIFPDLSATTKTICLYVNDHVLSEDYDFYFFSEAVDSKRPPLEEATKHIHTDSWYLGSTNPLYALGFGLNHCYDFSTAVLGFGPRPMSQYMQFWLAEKPKQ